MIAGALFLASLLMIPIDEVLLRKSYHALDKLDDWLHVGNLFYVCKYFGEVGLFLVMIPLLAFVDRRHRHYIVLLIAMWLTVALSMQVLKEIVGRARPVHSLVVPWEEQAKEPKKELKFPIPREGDVWYMVWHEGRPNLETSLRSFPSGHAGNAVTMALFLTMVYGLRWRPVWYAIALFCILDRVYRFQHFVSDMLAGAVWGWVFSQLVLYLFERRRQKRSEQKPSESTPGTAPA